MPTAYFTAPTADTGKGFITHDDQIVLELSFSIVANIGETAYVRVTGNDEAIDKWSSRVKVTPILEATVNKVVESLPISEEEQIRKDIGSITARISLLEASALTK